MRQRLAPDRLIKGCPFRFIKIPLRPAGTEDWTEEQLQALVTRDAVIGVRYPKTVEEFKKEGGLFHPKTEGYALSHASETWHPHPFFLLTEASQMLSHGQDDPWY